MSDEERDVIWEEGAEAARNAWGPLGSPRHYPCPYPSGNEKSEAWWDGFNSEYAKSNGY